MPKQGVTGIRRADRASTFRSVERERVAVDFAAPETRLEGVAQSLRARLERRRNHSLTQLPRQLRAVPASGIDIGLHLDQRDRAFGQASVRMAYGIEESFQPWFLRPRPAFAAYSTKPSPSRSP